MARGKEVERPRQAMKELEKRLKKQMEARSRDRRYYAKHFHGKNKLLAKREKEVEDPREQVEMIWGKLTGFGAAPGGSLSRTAPWATLRPSLARLGGG